MKLKCELHICLTKSVTKVTSIKTEIIPQLYRKLLQEPSLNFLGCLPHKRSFNAYHVFSRSNDREKTRNNMVVTRSPQEGHRESLPPQWWLDLPAVPESKLIRIHIWRQFKFLPKKGWSNLSLQQINEISPLLVLHSINKELTDPD